MDEQDDKHIQDDREIEIVDLEPDACSVAKPARVSRFSLAPRFTRRQRILQMMMTGGVVVLLLGVFLVGIPSVRHVASDAVSSLFPTPTPTLVPGVNRFYFDVSPSWGHLLVDRKAISPLPRFGTKVEPLTLSPGGHILTWQAYPFSDQQCSLSVPPNFRTDTCQFNSTITDANGNSAWLVSFSVSLSLLPSPERTVLIQTIQTALNAQQASATVQVDEPYAVSTSYAQSMYSSTKDTLNATQQMNASLHFRLDTNPDSDAICINSIFGQSLVASCSLDGQDCRLFCSVPAFIQNLSFPTKEWVTFAMVRTTWSYSTLNGRVLATDQPDNVAASTIPDEHLMPLSIAWDGAHWHVTTPFTDADLLVVTSSNPICFPAQDSFNFYGTFIPNIPGNMTYSLRYVAAPNYADGCLVVMTLQQESLATPTPVPPITAYYVQRFGVLVALNAAAHQLWPTMPLADSYEQKLVQQVFAIRP